MTFCRTGLILGVNTRVKHLVLTECRALAEDARVLREHGLLGMEVYNFYHTAEQTAFYRELAAELDLVATAGSDFHGRIKPHVAFGALTDGDYGMVERLKERRRGGA